MSRYVLTGAPGAGKTAILRQLEVEGCRVVEEAATDVIALEHACGRAEPWRSPEFADKIVSLQRQREQAAGAAGPDCDALFFDRSPVCTLALTRHLGRPPSALLSAEVDRVLRDGVYAADVFFIRNQGWIAPTAARRITYPDSLAFEDVHERTYRELGFRLIEVPAGPLAGRVGLIRREAGQHPAQPSCPG